MWQQPIKKEVRGEHANYIHNAINPSTEKLFCDQLAHGLLSFRDYQYRVLKTCI